VDERGPWTGPPRLDYRGTKLMFGGIAVAIVAMSGSVSYHLPWLLVVTGIASGVGIVGAVMHQRAFNRFVRGRRTRD
jgi:hypothetical protein